MNYKKLTGVILKKQNYREADQIITIWTQELGKVRVLAKGLRLAKSKLVYSLQDLSLVTVEISGKNLPTLIGASCVQQFNTLGEDLQKAAIAFYASELMLKLTADEHPNVKGFELLVEFLQALDTQSIGAGHKIVDEFAIDLAQSLGFGAPEKVDSHGDINQFIENLIERNLKSDSFLTLNHEKVRI